MTKPKQPLPLRPVVAEDHPDLVGGIIWSACEIEWINNFGERCYNHGIAKGMEAGNILFNENRDIQDMAMIIRRMANAIEKQSILFQLSELAMDYLKRIGLDGNALRDDKSDCHGQDWTERDGECLK